MQIKPLDFTEMICCMRPNIWASLADEVSASVSDKRNTTSVDRTVRWLDECIALSSEKECMFSFLFPLFCFDLLDCQKSEKRA